jgi:hypothetical protein
LALGDGGPPHYKVHQKILLIVLFIGNGCLLLGHVGLISLHHIRQLHMHQLFVEDACIFALLQLPFGLFQPLMEQVILTLEIVYGALHVTTLLLPLATAQTSTFSIFEQSVLFAWQKFPHTYYLRLAHLLNVDHKVTNPHDVSLLNVIIQVVQ